MKTRLLWLLAVLAYGMIAIALTPVWLHHYDALPIVPRPAFALMASLMGGSTQDDVADSEAATIFVAIVISTAPIVLALWWGLHRRK